MRYFLDTEFNGFGGRLISLGLVREDGASCYYVLEASRETGLDPWVRANVLPILWDCPHEAKVLWTKLRAAQDLESFLAGDAAPHIISDWPDDIRHFCELIVTGPGFMINAPALSFEVRRVDAWPNAIPGAVQHNAWWDAQALRHKVLNLQGSTP